MKTALASALIPAAAIATLIHATPAAATPGTPSADTTCGTTLQSWMPHALAGVQWHTNAAVSYETRIDIGTDGRANWKMGGVETNGHDQVWIEGNSARFRSDLGRGWGDMWEFTLWQPTCNAAGHVVSAHARTDVPMGFGGVHTYTTRPAEPFKAV
jgi:hypothetical protein